ncbi:MAG: methylenetetrahydrofolate reductase C-terminal domain-containing protein [Arenicellales bacterium]
MRKWSVSRAAKFDFIYQKLEKVLVWLEPFWMKLGYERVEKPLAFIEKHVKGFLFDCQMCGQCALHDTGMSCPMNCPKKLRNGPCGGVRANGKCELDENMNCVWVEAWRGQQLMTGAGKQDAPVSSILAVQFPVDHRLAGHSSWLRAVRLKHQDAEQN